jgi:hypothetical protein
VIKLFTQAMAQESTYLRVHNGLLGQTKRQRLPDAIVELEIRQSMPGRQGKFAANNISGTPGLDHAFPPGRFLRGGQGGSALRQPQGG